MLPTSCVEN